MTDRLSDAKPVPVISPADAPRRRVPESIASIEQQTSRGLIAWRFRDHADITAAAPPRSAGAPGAGRQTSNERH